MKKHILFTNYNKKEVKKKKEDVWDRLTEFIERSSDHFGQHPHFFTFREEKVDTRNYCFKVYSPLLPLEFSIPRSRGSYLSIILSATLGYKINNWKGKDGKVSKATLKLIILILKKHCYRKDYRLKQSEEKVLNTIRFMYDNPFYDTDISSVTEL
jgi:hypothetical protein